MRCEERSGFLILHRCERMAQYPCTYCGKQLCVEHAFAVDPKALAAAPVQAPPSSVAIAPPNASQVIACQACLRVPQAQQAQTGQTAQTPGPGYRDDYYYSYPYYGSYHPYAWGYDYDERDRRAFDRGAATGDQADALAS